MWESMQRVPQGARRSVSRVLSRPKAGMAIHLGRSSPNASRDRPERRRGRPARRRRRMPMPPAAPTWSCSRWGFPCHRRCRRRGALLPHHFTLAAHAIPRRAHMGSAVCFLWHFPWGRPRRALPGTVPPWSPDFPPFAKAARPGRRAAIRPSGMGSCGIARPRCQRSKVTRSARRAPHQRNEAPRRFRGFAAAIGEVERRDEAGGAVERPVGDAVHP